MIIIEDEEIVGWESAIIGMRNPMNSWDKSDSWYGCGSEFNDHLEPEDCDMDNCKNCHFCIGKNDLDLMKRLAKAGTDHRKFMRMIVVYVDVTSPLYWWKEFDTYKVGTVRNSCSTMHKITEKEFTLDDFSHEHLSDDSIKLLKDIVFILNFHREKYLETKDKNYWWQLIQLLPSSYNQRATLMLNYEVLANMYHSRKNHKLDEWHIFCDWIETLPHSELITGEIK